MMFLLFVIWVGLLVCFLLNLLWLFCGLFCGVGVFFDLCGVGLLIWRLAVCLGMYWWVGWVVGVWFGLLFVLVWFVEVVLFCFFV